MNAEMGRQMGMDINAPSALARKGKPVEVAALVGYLLGPESMYTTGAAYVVDGGWVC
jgi:NAD(P)-dependent dehydrogenase (short-subunit alcohol dehydrogenase family)